MLSTDPPQRSQYRVFIVGGFVGYIIHSIVNQAGGVRNYSFWIIVLVILVLVGNRRHVPKRVLNNKIYQQRKIENLQSLVRK